MFVECSRMYIYLILNDCKTLLLQREKTNNQYLDDFFFVLLLPSHLEAAFLSKPLSNHHHLSINKKAYIQQLVKAAQF